MCGLWEGGSFCLEIPSDPCKVLITRAAPVLQFWCSMAGAKRVEDLEAYKLAVQVRRRVFQLTKRTPVASDFRFVAQIRDAARGGSRNISEGFARFAPNEFRVYLSYARSSMSELEDELEDGFDSEYFTGSERNEVRALIERTIGAIAGLMEYLESPTARRFYEEHRKRRRLKEWEQNPNPNENQNQNQNENPK
jgi:four helix bundle protein